MRRHGVLEKTRGRPRRARGRFRPAWATYCHRHCHANPPAIRRVSVQADPPQCRGASSQIPQNTACSSPHSEYWPEQCGTTTCAKTFPFRRSRCPAISREANGDGAREPPVQAPRVLLKFSSHLRLDSLLPVFVESVGKHEETVMFFQLSDGVGNRNIGIRRGLGVPGQPKRLAAHALPIDGVAVERALLHGVENAG